MRKTFLKVLTIILLLSSLAVVLLGCKKSTDTTGKTYTIPQIDLSKEPLSSDSKFKSLFQLNIVDDGSDYMAHPDSVLLNNGNIMTVYPEGHGKGPVLTKISEDGGVTWGNRLTNTPESWKNSKETPTIYRLNFNDGSTKLVLISANCSWHIPGAGDGFMASISSDEGASWTEFKKFYGKGSSDFVDPIVAMASLTRLKDANGQWRDAWMGFFHDYSFYNYKSILTFENGEMVWSAPEKYFANYRKIEKNSSMCEVEVVRSEQGQGNELMLLTRSNGKGAGKKNNNSMMSVSKDEGATWSEPKELPQAVSGERLKADYLPDGRLFITFRSIERDPEMLKKYAENKKYNWYSEGWIAWVGTYDDLKNGNEGQYRIKLAHTYLNGQTEPARTANGDTGYCGNVILPDGRIMTSTYGCFGEKNSKGEFKTYIAAKTLDIKLIDELYNRAINKK